jgi:hypothetical protein
MNYEDIPDDLGDPGVGPAFKKVFEEWLAEIMPGTDPAGEWAWLWHNFDSSEGDITDIELACSRMNPRSGADAHPF